MGEEEFYRTDPKLKEFGKEKMTYRSDLYASPDLFTKFYDKKCDNWAIGICM